MASLAFGPVYPIRGLTDRRSDVRTIRSLPSPGGLTGPEIVKNAKKTFDVRIESDGDSRTIHIVLSKPGAESIMPILPHAAALLGLPVNWDRQGAAPIGVGVIETALENLAEVLAPDTIPGQWTPTQNSGAQIDWHDRGVDLEVTFEPHQNDGYAVFEDQLNPDNSWDGSFSENFARLRSVFRERLKS